MIKEAKTPSALKWAVGGHLAGRAAGRGIYNLKISRLSTSKKALHRIGLKLSKTYRRKSLKNRTGYEAIGADLGQAAGGGVGAYRDFQRMMREPFAWSSGARSSGARYSRAGYRPPSYKSSASNLKNSMDNLGIPKSGIKTKRQAKKYYQKKAMKTHPDNNPGIDPKEFRKTRAAWDDVQASSWYEKLAYVLHKHADKKSKRKLLGQY